MLCNKEVKQLTENVRQLHELNHILEQYMPSLLSQYCQLKSYSYGNLTMEASSGAAATQLRFLQPQLIAKLRNHPKFSGLQKISVKVASQQPKLDRQYTRQVEPVSQQNRTLIRDTASTINDDSLASSMRNLADTLDNYGKD